MAELISTHRLALVDAAIHDRIKARESMAASD
jgi:hypothetical protein